MGFYLNKIFTKKMKFKSSTIVIFIFAIQNSVAVSISYDVINQPQEHYDVTKKDVPVADNITEFLSIVKVVNNGHSRQFIRLEVVLEEYLEVRDFTLTTKNHKHKRSTGSHDENSEVSRTKRENKQQISSNLYVSPGSTLANNLVFCNPVTSYAKRFNNLKYVFDITKSDAKDMLYYIHSPNFYYDYYPNLSFIEYKIMSAKSTTINLRITDFNIEQFGDILYLYKTSTQEMRLIQSNQVINTNENEISLIFKSDCTINTGKFKLIVDFTQYNNQTTTKTTQKHPYTTTNSNYLTNKNNKQTAANVVETTHTSYSNKHSFTDRLDTTTIDYKTTTSNLDNFETSTN